MKMRLWKRGLSLLLIAVLSMNIVIPEKGIGHVSLAQETNEIVLMANGKEAAASNHVEIPYGDKINLSVDGYNGSEKPYYFYLSGNTTITEDTEWVTEWTDSSFPTAVGSYYIAMALEDSGQNINIQQFDGRYKISIVKAELAVPTQRGWKNGSTASWSAVTKTTTGTQVADSTIEGYKIQLYKDGQAVGNAVTPTGLTMDFTDEIRENGKGVYTYTVNTIAKDTNHYTDSKAEPSQEAAYGVEVTVDKDKGISSVTPEEPAFLIAGNSSYNSFEASAVVKEGYTFAGWTYGDITGFEAEDSSKKSTTFTLNSCDADNTNIVIKAAADDVIAPTISNYIVNDANQLEAVFKDDGEGVTAYSFSAETETAKVDWNAVDAASQMTGTYDVAAPGVYYAWVKDKSGNTVKSVKGYQATKITYHNYFKDGGFTNATGYYLGEDSYSVLVCTREGYTLEGWYTNEDFSGEKISAISSHSMQGIELYAKWSMNQVTFENQLQSVDKVYDGTNTVLNGKISNDTGNISYQWYRDDKLIEGADKAEYKVKDVLDSGVYKVTVTIQIGNDKTVTTSNAATISIHKKPLSIKAKEKTITFGDDKPVLDAAFDSFVDGEDQTDLKGSLAIVCDYIKGQDAGKYPITVSGYISDNYEISYETADVTVAPKDVKAEKSDVSVSNPSDSIYDGLEHKPAVSVKDADVSIPVANYDVVYSNNVNAGKANVTVSFHGNYTGEITKTFNIGKASFETSVIVSDWIYGDTACTPSLVSNVSGGETVWYYSSDEGKTYSTSKPANAGAYKIYAKIKETTDYYESITAPVDFTISKRDITLTAADGEWAYDGNEHTNNTYQMDGTFAGDDDFLSVAVTGSIRDKGTKKNVVTYILTSSTNENNYNIECVSGTLTVQARQMSVPAGVSWSTTAPGRGIWVAVVKDGVNVQYKVQLFDSDKNMIWEDTTDSAYYDFSTVIKEYTDVAGSYTYSVMAIPFSGENASNYESSNMAQVTSELYTASVNVVKGTGIQSAVVTKEDKTAESMLLIQGETASVQAEVETGYQFNSPVWSVSSANAGCIAFDNAKKSSALIKVSSTLSQPEYITIVAASNDMNPVISDYHAVRNEAGNRVTLSATVSDARALDAFAVTTSAEAPERESDSWVALDGVLSKSISQVVSEKGTYYVWVRDDAGNVVGSEGISIYRVTFIALDAVGTMNSVLKVQNTQITLPQNAFTKTDYGFQQWKGTTGYYGDEGVYSANSDDLLQAQWTNEIFDYKVQYYFMNTNGEYADTPEQTKTFSAGAGSTVRTTDEKVQITKTGFTYDTNQTQSIVISGKDQIMKAYYKRNQYQITYQYTFNGEKTDYNTDTFYYGETVSEAEKPEKAGYNFVGWLYGNVGSKPENMPENNIAASGYFTPQSASYKVNCYTKNLSGGEYTLASSTSYAGQHDQAVSADITSAPEIDGFSAAGLVLSNGVPAGTNPVGMTESANGTLTASQDELNINYYYSRNTYSVTLNVWKGSRTSETNRIYTEKWDIPYGTVLNPDDYSEGSREQWEVGHEDELGGYVLADYSDWSTGDVPTVMPAGNVVVARDYVSTTLSEYKIQVFYETAVEDNYVKQADFTYYGQIGALVTAGSGDGYTIDVNNFKASLAYLTDRYEYTNTDESVESGTVLAPDDANGPLIMKVYFKRKNVNTVIRYYCSDDTGASQTLFATKTISAKWGQSYEVDFDKFFYGDAQADGYTISDEQAVKKDYCSSNYVASYTSYSSAGWKTHEIMDLDDLTQDGTFTSVPPKSKASNYVNIYYTKADPQTQVVVNMTYQTSGLNQSSDTQLKPLTINTTKIPQQLSFASEELDVRVVNRAYLFESNYVCGTEAAGYPGVKYVTGSYTVGDALKDGFFEVTVDGYEGTFYTDLSSLYVVNENNDFFLGNRVSYNFGNNKPGYDKVADFLETYKNEHKDSTAADYDPEYAGAYIVYNNFGGVLLSSTSVDYKMYFEYKETHTVTYNVGGTTCNNHKYPNGEVAQIGCEDSVFESRAGYHISWYYDSEFTEPVTNDNADKSKRTINSEKTIYGHYVKDTLRYGSNISYQLPQEIIYGDGQKTNYLTKDLIAQIDEERITSAVETDDVDFVDGEGNTVNEVVETTRYYYDGELALIYISRPVLSFTDVSEDYNTYVKDGFYFDTTNTGNMSHCYCADKNIDFASYYTRNIHQLTIVRNNSKIENTDPVLYRMGADILVQKPEKEGYVFAGWKMYMWDDGLAEWKKWTDAPALDETGVMAFAMPDQNVKMEAAWTPTIITSTITSYFQNNEKKYDKELLSQCKASSYTETKGAWTLYFGDEDKTMLQGVSKVENDITYYYRCADVQGEDVTVKQYDLFAAQSPITKMTEAVVDVQDSVLTQIGDMYTFSFMIYQYDDSVTNYESGQSFVNMPGMQVENYYTLSSGYEVRIDTRATDGGTSGVVVKGEGNYVYHGDVALHAAVEDGYTFVGWYRACDVLKDYDAEGTEELSSYEMKDISSIPAVETDTTFSYTMENSEDYVTVTKPKDVCTANVVIEGKTEYEYGYNSNSTDRVLTAKTSLPDDADEANFIYGYQWYTYENGEVTAIDGARAATYNFPGGKEKGTYKYFCAVTVKRQDNGRTLISKSGDYTVEVAATNVQLETSNYSGVYDGGSHAASVKVTGLNTGYTIYYGTEELSADNYLEKGSIINIAYKDVKMDGTTPQAQKVYYYIHCENTNYLDQGGYVTVTIRPKELTLTSAGVFSKTYDGMAEVTGDVKTQGTQAYELANSGAYTVNGMISGEYKVLDFKASFNSSHVDGANSVCITEPSVLQLSGEKNDNYTFDGDYALTIPGYISPKPVNVIWSNQAFTYDGEKHQPTVSMTQEDIPIELEVTGGQTNVGSYVAYANVKDSDAYENSDYLVAPSSSEYTIGKKDVLIEPKDTHYTYDGTVKYITEFSTTGLLDGDSFTAGTTVGRKSAGEENNVSAKNMVITSSANKNVTDNYEISYGTATLTINKRKVVFEGVSADDKVYDANANASLNMELLEFDGIISGDELSLINISGTFDSANVGNDKDVTLIYDKASLSGSSAANYELDLDNSQKTIKADIKKAALYAAPCSGEVIYGDEPSLQVSYRGFVGTEDESVIDGEPTFTVKKDSVDFSRYSGVGTYNITLNTENMLSDNYVIEADNSQSVSLEVKKKSITASAAEVPTVTKVYDALTAADDCVDVDDYVLDGVVHNDEVNLSFEARFDTKNVTASYVNMDNLAVDNDNYDLTTDSFHIPASIMPKPLTITANPISVLYGTQCPLYSVAYSSFAADETKDDLTGTLAYDCDYDSSVSDKRKVGTYTITPKGYNDGNYAITYVPGVLTVTPAALTITAQDKQVTYGDVTPEFTYSVSGFLYNDADKGVNGSISYVCEREISGEAKEYLITPVLTGLTAENYQLVGVNGTLTVNKKSVAFSSITAKNKEYDGLTSASLVTSSLVRTGMSDEDYSSHVVTIRGTFENKDASENKKVALSYSLDSYLAKRYEVSAESQSSTTANITKKELVVTADNKEILYGNAAPTYTVSYEGFVDGDGVDSLDASSFAITCPYVENSPAAQYDITATGYSSSNYSISYCGGALTVKQNALQMPVPQWSSQSPGTVTWDKAVKIGGVDVDHYVVSLYSTKDTENAVSTCEVAATDTCAVDYKEIMRSQGEGSYYSSIKAVPKTDNNALFVNVKESTGQKSALIWAAKVSAVLAADEVTTAGGQSTQIKGGASYVVIAGESGIPVSAVLKNATGYGILSWGGETGKLTTSQMTHVDGSVDVSATMSLAADYAKSTADLVLTLNATPVTLGIQISKDKESAIFGYSQEMSPTLSVTASVAEGDNITEEKYVYAYRWQIKNRGQWADLDNGSEYNYTVPTGKAVGTYQYRCVVTATREDNAKKTTKNSSVIEVPIERSTFSAFVSMQDWTYGGERNTPVISSSEGEVQGAVYYYSSEENGQYTTDVPTDAGHYYLYAFIPESANYTELTTDKSEFDILVNQLDTPANLQWIPSLVSPAGTASWTAVSGIKENAGAEDFASEITPSYRINIYKNNTLIETIDDVAQTTCDVSQYITEKASYTFTVQAISNCVNNCLNGEESQIGHALVIDRVITTDNTFNKVYDASPIVLSVESKEGEQYQWYKNGTLVAGAKNNTLHVTNVADTGYYQCMVTKDDTVSYSDYHQVTITKAEQLIAAQPVVETYDGTSHSVEGEVTWGDGTLSYQGNDKIKAGQYTVVITASQTANYNETKKEVGLTISKKEICFTADSADKVYDGLPLTKRTYTCTDMAAGDTVQSVNVVGSQTTAGSHDNIISSALIQNAESEDVTNCYEIEYVKGLLAVSKKPITITADNDSKPYDGTALTKNSFTSSAAAVGDVIDSAVVSGSQTNYGQSDNTVSGAVIKNAEGSEVTSSYEISYVKGTLTVTTSVTNISITNDISKTYDCAPVESPDVSCNSTAQPSFTYYDKNHNKLDYVPVNAGTYYVEAAVDESADHNYKQASAAPVLFTIGKADQMITASDVNAQYDGTIHSVTASVSKGDGDISYKDGIQGKVNAGEYTITAIASETDNYKLTQKDIRLVISRKLLTIIADCETKPYDGEPLTSERYTSSELAEGDYIESVKVTGSQTEYGVGDNVVSDAVIANVESEDVTSSYIITYVKGTLTVTLMRTNIAITNDISKIYDGAAVETPMYECDSAGVVSIEYYDKDKNLMEGAPVNAGNYYVRACVARSMDNLAAQTEYVPFCIEKASQSIVADDVTAEYDGLEHAVTASVETGDGALSYLGGIRAETKAGRYVITAMASETANYKPAKKDIQLIITKKSLTITAQSAEKIYDGTALKKNDFNVEGLVTGDAVESVKMTGSRIDYGTESNVPSEAVIHNTANENVTSCYDISYINGSLSVNTAQSSIAITGDAGKTYDGRQVSNPAAANNNSEKPSYRYYDKDKKELEAAPKNVGNYYVRAFVAEQSNHNYGAASTDYVSFAITKRAVTVTAASDTKAYDGTELTNTKYETTKLADGDSVRSADVTGSQKDYGTSDNAVSNAVIENEYGIDVTANYDITYVSGRLTIGSSAVELKITENISKVYDGAAAKKPTYTCGSPSTVTVNYYNSEKTLLESAPVCAGDYYVKASAAESANHNYAAQETEYIPFRIEQKALTITADSAEKVYDGTVLTKNAYTSQPLAAGDEIENVVVEGSQTEAGTSNNTPSSAIIHNSKNENVTNSYSVSYISGTLMVSRAEDTLIIANNISKQFDEKPVDNPSITRKSAGQLTFVYYDAAKVKLEGAPLSVGNYYVQVFEAQTTNYNAAKSEMTGFSITVPDVLLVQSSPVAGTISASDTTFADDTTGTISGVDTTMEYSQNGGKTWIGCTQSKIENLPSGTYLVRYKQTELYQASEPVSVTIKSRSAELHIPTIVMSKTMGFKQKFQMKLLNVKGAVITCSSSNTKVVTVNKKGVISSKKKKGKAKIVVNIVKGQYKAQYILNVKTSKSVKKNYSLVKHKAGYKHPSIALYKLMSKGQKYKVKLKNVTKKAKITYSSNKKKIATVSKKGVIKAKGTGKAIVSITVNESGKVYKWFMVIRVAKKGVQSDVSYLKVLK